NTQNHGLLTITDGANAQGNRILHLDWSSSLDTPAITWSLGTAGHVSSIWMRGVGAGETTGTQLLASGNYTEAIYTRSGGWILLRSGTGNSLAIWHLAVTSPSHLVLLISGKQVSFVQWSPDGLTIVYV